jgi:hypothetical protein
MHGSSGFREIEIGWNLGAFLPHFCPSGNSDRTQRTAEGRLMLRSTPSHHRHCNSARLAFRKRSTGPF